MNIHNNSQVMNDLKQFIRFELLNLNQMIEDSVYKRSKKLSLIKIELSELRNNMFPYQIQKEGLKSCLENLLIQNPFKLNFTVNYNINYSTKSLNQKEEFIIYKILFEALSNISKHANASHALLIIQEFQDSINVEIHDNGIGFQLIPVIQSGHAFGLKSMMDNCILLNSSAYIDSENNGTKISFQIPLSK